MLLSRRHGFLFVHVPKAAGTSMERALAKACEPTPNRGPLQRPIVRALRRTPLARPLGLWRDLPGHSRASELRRALPPEIWDASFKFAFVRHPLDRLVSQYWFLLQSPDHRRHGRVAALGSFSAFVRYEAGRGRFTQLDHLESEDGAPLLDFVGRFERLEQDWSAVERRLGLEAPLPRANASRHAPWREHYDDATLALALDVWGAEIERLEYTVD